MILPVPTSIGEMVLGAVPDFQSEMKLNRPYPITGACGENRGVLGLAGMAVRAGARSTIASLWSFKDQSAVEFIGHFYEQLVQGKSRAKALRQAQLMFLQQKNGSDNPLYWTPYI